jgi:hypothetical protein
MGSDFTDLKLEAHQGSIFLGMADFYGHLYDPFAQLVENDIDSHASKIKILISDSSIITVGDGRGMEKDMLPGEYEKLLQLISALRDKKISDHEIRKQISWASRQTIRYMLFRVGASGKLFGEQEKRQKGAKGVGLLSVYNLGNEIVISTRPSLELARKFNPKIVESGILTYRFELPTREDLGRDQRRVRQFSENTGRLPGILSKELGLVSGTRVEIRNLNQAVLAKISAKALANFLTYTFPQDLREGLSIEIIDQRAGKSKVGSIAGQVEIVQKPNYPGRLFYENTLRLPMRDQALPAEYRNKEIPINLRLFYYPEGRKLRVSVLRFGRRIFDINDLGPPFDEGFWVHGRVSGEITCPDLPDEVFGVTLQKDQVVQSPAYNQWLNKLKNDMKNIRSALDKADAEFRKEEEQSVNALVTEALAKTLQEDEVFAEMFGEEQPTRRPRLESQSYITNSQPDWSIRVVLNDEHGIRLDAVDVELLQSGKQPRKLTSQSTGVVTFENLPMGEYGIRVTPPPNCQVIGDKDVAAISITRRDRTAFVRFKIHTHTAKLKRRRISTKQVKVLMVDLHDHDALYSLDRMTLGSLLINREQPEINLASKSDKEGNLLDNIIADVTGLAIAEWCFPNARTPWIYHQIGRFQLKLLWNIRRLRKKK